MHITAASVINVWSHCLYLTSVQKVIGLVPVGIKFCFCVTFTAWWTLNFTFLLPCLKGHCHRFARADQVHFKFPSINLFCPNFFKYPFPFRVYSFSIVTATISQCPFKTYSLTITWQIQAELFKFQVLTQETSACALETVSHYHLPSIFIIITSQSWRFRICWS